MPTNYLPSDDHIARHIKPSLIMRDEVTHEAVGIFPQAFELRDAERDLSVSWLEVFAGSSFDQIRQVMEHTELRLSPRHGFGILSVLSFVEACASQGAKVRIIHEPTPGNPAHAAVHQYPRDKDELKAILASIASQRLITVDDIQKGPPVSAQ